MKTEGMTEDEINARHAEKMAKKKAARDRMIATKTLEKGLLIVHTGKGIDLVFSHAFGFHGVSP